MSSPLFTSWTSPGTATINTKWVNKDDALADNDLSASSTTADKDSSGTLTFSNFGFAIPTEATVLNVRVRMDCAATEASRLFTTTYKAADGTSGVASQITPELTGGAPTAPTVYSTETVLDTPDGYGDVADVNNSATAFSTFSSGGQTSNVYVQHAQMQIEYHMPQDLETGAPQISTPSLGHRGRVVVTWAEIAAETIPVHALTADDVQSASELSTPVIGQDQALLGDDLESATQLSTPVIGQLHGVQADDLESAAQISTPDIGDLFQRLIPISDDSNNGWVTHTGASTNLYQQIDESPDYDDADYIRCPIAPNREVYRVKLGTVTPTPLPSADQKIKFRLRREPNTTHGPYGRVRLYNGVTLIATRTWGGLPADFGYFTYQLTQTEKDAITDYDDLYLEFDFDLTSY